MLFRLIYDEDLAQGAYLIGCQRTGEAIVFDPERDIDRYLDLARAHGLRIVAVAETHIHADFLSGAREIAERTDAHVYVSGEGGADWRSKWIGRYEATEVRDGDEFTVGNIRFRVRHTPGHTPEHVSYLVLDEGGGADEPIGVVTGDFVFVGDLGRPDLLETAAGVVGSTEDAAKALAKSARSFLELPDHLQVWPAHGSGSACGKALGAVPQSTVGYERRFNDALRSSEDEAAFVESIVAGQPEPPKYFARMKAWNRDGVPLLPRVPRPEPRGAGELDELLAMDRIAVVDLRSWGLVRKGHLPGTLWAPTGPPFLMAIGSYVEPDDPIVIVGEGEEVERAIRNLVRIGLDRIEGVVRPIELELWGARTGGLQQAPEISAEELLRRIDADGAGNVLDVRRRPEWDAAHLDGATLLPHTRLMAEPERLPDLPDGEPLLVHCAGGVRSASATLALRRAGREAVNVAGGWAAIRKAKDAVGA